MLSRRPARLASMFAKLRGGRMHVVPMGSDVGSPASVEAVLREIRSQRVVAEIAEAIGVSRVWYAMIESGRGQVSPRLLGRIAEALMLEQEERLALIRLAFTTLATFPLSEAS